MKLLRCGNKGSEKPAVYGLQYNGSKIIETAGYGYENYANSLDCQWKIEVGPSKVVKLTIINFETETE